MEKIINKLIDEFTKGVDTYTHNGSTWLIFTDTKQWVIELTDSKTLWYNYNFFKGMFAYASMDVVENQQYITKWVEDNIINKVSDIRFRDARDNKHQLEDTIQNGSIDSVRVNEYSLNYVSKQRDCEDTIENGVKKTNSTLRRTLLGVDDIIQNGIKETRLEMNITEGEVDDIIQDGVKETNPVDVMKFFDNKMEDALQNGVKETHNLVGEQQLMVDDAIENGIKETSPCEYLNPNTGIFHGKLGLGIREVIKNGVKETSHRQFLKTYDVKDTIQDGTEHDRWILDGCDDPVDEVLDNGIKETLRASYLNVDNVIQDGVKITSPLQSREYTGDIDEVLGNGIKSSIPRQYVGEIIIDKVIDKGVIETHREICEYKHTVEHIIQTGVKETYGDDYHNKDRIDGVIKNGVKEIYNYKGFRPRNIDDIIDNGIKETQPLPAQDLNGDWSEYYHRKEDITKPHTKYVDEVIEDGVKIHID